MQASSHTQHTPSLIAHTPNGRKREEGKRREGRDEEPGKQSAERVLSCVLALLFIYLFLFCWWGETVSKEQAKRNEARRNEERSQIQKRPVLLAHRVIKRQTGFVCSSAGEMVPGAGLQWGLRRRKSNYMPV